MHYTQEELHKNVVPVPGALTLITCPKARAHRKAQLLYYLSNAVNYYANIPDPEEERGIDSYGGGVLSSEGYQQLALNSLMGPANPTALDSGSVKESCSLM
jgi:hypothetical protein